MSRTVCGAGTPRARPRKYPALAAKLGLSLRDAAGSGTGTLTGEVDGYRVFVDPDDRARIVVYTRAEPQIVLRTYSHEKRVPAGMVAVTPEGLPNGFLRDAYAGQTIAPVLHARDAELGALLRPFAERWPRTVAHLSVIPERLECALDFGRPTHIPPEVVEALLPAAISLLRFLESLPESPTG